MKAKSITNAFNSVRNSLTVIVMSLVVAVAMLPSTASANETIEKKSQVEVKYVGKIDQQPVYEVNINNLRQENLLLAIRDEEGTVLYTEKLTGNKVSKKFQFAQGAAEDLTFSINLIGKNREMEVYRVNSEKQVSSDIVVTAIQSK